MCNFVERHTAYAILMEHEKAKFTTNMQMHCQSFGAETKRMHGIWKFIWQLLLETKTFVLKDAAVARDIHSMITKQIKQTVTFKWQNKWTKPRIYYNLNSMRV